MISNQSDLESTLSKYPPDQKSLEGWKLMPPTATAEMVAAARYQHEGEYYLPMSLYQAMFESMPVHQPNTTGLVWTSFSDRWPEEGAHILFCEERGTKFGVGTDFFYKDEAAHWTKTGFWAPMPVFLPEKTDPTSM